MPKSSLKPPLPRSPIRLRTRQVPRSNSVAPQTPPGSLNKSQKPTRIPYTDLKPDLRPEYNSISCELHALAKMVRDEFGNEDEKKKSATNLDCVSKNSIPLFERGRFYQEYSVRRNERLRRRRGELLDEVKGTPYSLHVSAEPTKKRGTAKKMESLKRSVSAAYNVERDEKPRYALRSTMKENKKPPLPVDINRSLLESQRKTRRARKI